ncbi:MAG TPA: hypothetical protein VHN14_00165, partial [Kofleriaceae bacterium]|nr:hypothetical protein [Kofleriaceae bacterium]
MMFATAGCSASEPLWSSPPETDLRAHPNFAEADRKELDTSRFVLIVDDDPNLLDVTRFVIESEGMA